VGLVWRVGLSECAPDLPDLPYLPYLPYLPSALKQSYIHALATHPPRHGGNHRGARFGG
jgi:hypothetical protein